MRFLLGLGSNLGDRRAMLEAAVRGLEARGASVTKRSSVYETDPVGGPPGQPQYLNQAVAVSAPFGARRMLEVVQDVESSLGRAREHEVRWGPRAIDIDILAGDESASDADLIVPHPRLAERAFVLVPLAEIAPDLDLPGLGRVRDLLAALGDAAGVRPAPA